MKSVGQQLQEARQAKNWTPELAARETKIKVDRVRDLEADDYANFSSPTYARGFVRTYARALGLDEYKILRQLDNKLPEDDNASFGSDNGMPYVPEPSSQAMHVSSAPRTGLYIVLGLGCAIMFIIAFVLFEAYRAGELPRYFASTSAPDNATNTAPADAEAPQHALPVDANDTTHSVRAQPVDLNAGTNATAVATTTPATNIAPIHTGESPAATIPPPQPITKPDASTNAAPVAVAATTPMTTNAPPAVPVAKPVVPAPGKTAGEPVAPRALPVSASELAAEANSAPAAPTNAVAEASSPVLTTPVDLGPGTSTANAPIPSAAPATSSKRLVLTASKDSPLRITSLDHPPGKAVLYDSVLRAGQSLSFDGRKFSVEVANPSVVDIVLDGIYYGPHSDHQSPETFTLESHQP